MRLMTGLSVSNKEPIPTSGFDWKKALYALQGKFVITDETSPFEWVGSESAGPCIIMLVHGLNSSGQKVAACGHLSAAESPNSLDDMFGRSDITEVLSAHLVSGYSAEEEAVCQILLGILRERGVETPQLSLGKGVTEIALNVKSGEVSHNVAFTAQNAGEKDLSSLVSSLERYSIISTLNIYSSPRRPLLELSIDGRSAKDISRVQVLLETAETPVRHRDIFDTFAEIPVIKEDTFDTLLDNFTYRIALRYFCPNIFLKALPAPPERKMLTHPEWEAARKAREKPSPVTSVSL